MDLNHLKIFADVSRVGSYAALSREDGTDPSAISRTIASLESELGFRLFERTTRRLSLTQAGKIYLDQITPLLEGLTTARDLAKDTMKAPSGILRITSSVAFGEKWLLPRIASFQEKYPDIHLDLILSDIALDIVAERIDLAIRHAPSVDGALVISKLLKTNYQVVASQGYLEKYGRPQNPKEIEDHKGIFFSLSAFQLPWKFKEKAHGHILEFKPKAGLTISNALAVRKAALEGLGLALLADWTIDKDLKAGHLIDLFPEYEASASDFDSAAWIAYPSRAYVPAKLRVFIDHLKGCV